MIALIVVLSVIAWYIIGLVSSTYVFRENLKGIPTSQYQKVCLDEETIVRNAKWAVVFLALTGIFVGIYCFGLFVVPKTVMPTAKGFGNALVKLAGLFS